MKKEETIILYKVERLAKETETLKIIMKEYIHVIDSLNTRCREYEELLKKK